MRVSTAFLSFKEGNIPFPFSPPYQCNIFFSSFLICLLLLKIDTREIVIENTPPKLQVVSESKKSLNYLGNTLFKPM